MRKLPPRYKYCSQHYPTSVCVWLLAKLARYTSDAKLYGVYSRRQLTSCTSDDVHEARGTVMLRGERQGVGARHQTRGAYHGDGQVPSKTTPAMDFRRSSLRQFAFSFSF